MITSKIPRQMARDSNSLRLLHAAGPA